MISDKPLPPGWTEAALPDIAEVNPPNPSSLLTDDTLVSFVPMAAVEALSGRLDASNIQPWNRVKKGYTRFQDGDVLFAKITPSMENGKAAVARNLSKGVGAGSTEFHVLRPGPALQPELLLHYLLQEGFRKAARARMTGTAGQLRVPSRFLDEQTVPLPPRLEQHRVVEAIESYFTRLDDAVATLERVQRNLKRYRASVLKAAVEGRLVPTEAELARAEDRDYEPASALLERILAERRRLWEEAELAKMKAKGKVPKDDKWKAKYGEPLAPDASDSPELPEGWCWASPGQFFSWSSGEFLPKKAQKQGAVPVLGGNGVNGFHDLALVIEPTLVVGRVGAQCGNIHLTDGPAWITDNAIYASEGGEVAVLPFWRIVMSLKHLNANAGGTGQPYVNQKHLNDLVVALPPEAEQRRIVAAVETLVSVADHMSETLKSNAEQCTRLRQSILKWAFEGRLVDQDLSEEPASVLLTRIHAERQSSNGNPPKPRGRRNAKSTNS